MSVLFHTRAPHRWSSKDHVNDSHGGTISLGCVCRWTEAGGEADLGLPVRLDARLHARVVDGAGLAAGLDARGVFLAEAVVDDGAVDEGAKEGASVRRGSGQPSAERMGWG